ncbi:MAG: NADH-quinone oxidoreductase subunit [Blastococcus sp.]|jgi:NADH-quinone oxidoreductase subunit C|nr:NADH-quinone oxidoreductase subunit [Blastococcus sp.]
MSAGPVGSHARSLAERFAQATAEESHGQVTVDVMPADWQPALTVARDELGFTYFDWLTAVDQLDDADRPGFDVVAHVWSVPRREHLLVRTRVPAAEPRLATLTGVYAGASWHERETFEMFGVDFDGHPHLVPLLLPDGFEGHPLRKEFVLAARAAKPWPGAKEPGESDADGAGAPSRRKTRPPGVPDPAEWGPHPPSDAAVEAPPDPP